MGRQEKLLGEAMVKGTMLMAHLDWARGELNDRFAEIGNELPEPYAKRLERGVLATDWIALSYLVAVDRRIADLAPGRPAEVFRALGRHSAVSNLKGVYKMFVAEDPQRFFDRMKLIHGRFCSFGRPHYEALSESSGRIQIEQCNEYSPAFCASTRGYYEGVLETMRVAGPIEVRETTCQCSGDSVCSFELSW